LLGEEGPIARLGNVQARVRRRAHKAIVSPRELNRLGTSPHPAGPKLARAIRTVIAGTSSGEEREWAARIEALRSELLASSEELEVVDYGAVEPGMEIDVNDMYEGRRLRRGVGEICRLTSKPPQWALLLLELVRTFRPERCVELGTSLGISTSYQAAGLELNGTGNLVTLEGAAAVAERAAANLERLGLTERVEIIVGRFQDTLGTVLERIGPVEYAFVDGHHDRDATLAYFEQLAPYWRRKRSLFSTMSPGRTVWPMRGVGFVRTNACRSPSTSSRWESVSSEGPRSHAGDLLWQLTDPSSPVETQNPA
jgi:predicted O-methyltransferase YrrM